MVNLEDNYLLFFLAAIFIPLFGFLVKMLKESANTQTRLDSFYDHIEESKEKFDRLNHIDTEINVIKVIVTRIEKDIVELFRRGTRLSNRTSEDKRYDTEREER